MQSKLHTSLLEIADRARDVDSLFDGYEAAITSPRFFALFHLHTALEEHDAILEDLASASQAHTANAEGPDTEHHAAELARFSKTGTAKKIVDELQIVAHQGYVGCTDSDLEHRLRKPHTTVSSARNWLMNAGWVHDSSKTKITPSGRPAIVWSLTDAAWAELRRVE